MTRYLVKANGIVIDHAETEKKAWRKARNYEYECSNQDEPCFPKMSVEYEVIDDPVEQAIEYGNRQRKINDEAISEAIKELRQML